MKRFGKAVGGVAAAALLFVTTTAVAGDGVGAVFNLGQTNSVGATSTLTGAVAGPQLTIRNTSTEANATALSLNVGSGRPPFKVSSSVKVAALNADQLDGKDSSALWQLGGNPVGATAVLGTTTNQPLELTVNGARVLRLEPTLGAPNVIGGAGTNSVLPGVPGATIAGGGQNSVNAAGGTVGGGSQNSVLSGDGTVAGGSGNIVEGNGSGAIGGGWSNTASGFASTIPGGTFNFATGQSSLAAGNRAHANDDGSFVWADLTNADFVSTGTNQFLVRAAGGARFVSGASTFSPTLSAFQAENAGGGGEAAWLRVGDASNAYSVASLIKQASGTGNFLTCWNESGGGFSTKCHIDKDGTYTAGSDFAESLPVRGAKVRYEPGDVLAISSMHAGQVVKSQHARDAAVIGVYSTRPGVLGADKGGVTRVGRNEVPVAITGIVPVKVSAENGPIRPGDLLTSASAPGRAMRAGAHPAVGTVLGKSLGFLERGTGVLKALVMQR